ncbi:M91 family zinc metallopeptidase [Legionella sp. CNM-1927-20]|uniref:M91 family zinc metallopeptidase n=1 Tax=Legionella sp. CNM-1927-20 TaxID=3422221 RepID=UPI00403B349A
MKTRPISEALMLLTKIRISKKKEFAFFKNNLEKRIEKIRFLLSEFEANKYPAADGSNVIRSKIFNQLQVKLGKKPSDQEAATIFTEIEEILQENILYYSPMPRYIYWQGAGKVSENPPGIAILCNDPRKQSNLYGNFPLDFNIKAINNLNYIALTKTGKILLDYLVDFSKKYTIEIWPSPENQGNRAIPHSLMAMDQVSDEVVAGRLGKEALQALEKASGTDNKLKQCEWLANCISKMPHITLEDPLEDKAYFEKPLSSEDIYAWLATGYDFLYKNFNKRAISQILCATITVLYPYTIPGLGSGTTVRWNAFDNYLRNNERPPAIGLAHELIHAFYNAAGLQPGKEQDDTTAVLEFLAVGLGIWENADMTENVIRAEWKDILNQIPTEDIQNHKVVERRTAYSTNITVIFADPMASSSNSFHSHA